MEEVLSNFWTQCDALQAKAHELAHETYAALHTQDGLLIAGGTVAAILFTCLLWPRRRNSFADRIDRVDKQIKSLQAQLTQQPKTSRLSVWGWLLVLIYVASAAGYVKYLAEDVNYDMIGYLAGGFVTLVFVLKVIQAIRSWKSRVDSAKLAKLQTLKASLLDRVKSELSYNEAERILKKYSEQPLSADSRPTPAPSKPAAKLPLQTPMPQLAARVAPAGPVSQLNQSVLSPGAFPGNSPGPRIPRPILPRERSKMDKVVEYFVGDGPNSRYALICKACFSHNGMALPDEFEYLAYRCGYCGALNPARKQRPQQDQPAEHHTSQPAQESAISNAVAASTSKEQDLTDESLLSHKHDSEKKEQNAAKEKKAKKEPTDSSLDASADESVA